MDEAKKKKEQEKKKEGTDDIDSQIKKIQDDIAAAEAEAKAKEKNGNGLNINSNINNTATTAAGDKKIKNINITIDRVIEHFTVTTTNLKESTERIKEIVAEAIIEGINDVNLEF